MARMIHNVGIFLISVALILLLQVGFIFFLIAVLPSIVAYFMDDLPAKNTYKTIRACNLAALLPEAVSVLQHNTGSLGAALQILISEPDVWIHIYGACLLGAGMLYIARWVSYFIISMSSETRIKVLKSDQEKLLEEWGPRIKG